MAINSSLTYTPMIEQYLSIKANYKEHLLLFRLGDFYELFFEDAVLASSLLDITLTKKSAGKDGSKQLKIDMCGVPFHSVDNYIAKLTQNNYKVAICEQIEDAKNVVAGKLVKRDVVRVVSSGTTIDTNTLDEGKNNYIICIFENKINISIATCDVSTGDFNVIQFLIAEKLKVIDEISKYNPSEILVSGNLSIMSEIESIFGIKVYVALDFYFKIQNAKSTLQSHFNIQNLSSFDIDNDPALISVSGALFKYLLDTQKNNLSHIKMIKKYSSSNFMFLDISSRRNLELTETIRDKSKKGSLLWVLDKTKTPMGARLIRKIIEAPLINRKEITDRLLAVKFLKDEIVLRADILEYLGSIKDIQRLISKISFQSANARDLISLKFSFLNLPAIKNSLKNGIGDLLDDLYTNFDTLDDLYKIIDDTLLDEVPLSLRDGGLIKAGINAELDIFTRAKYDGTNWLVELENEEKEKTGIKNLKIRFNKIFGYYIEVTNSNLNLVPGCYIRKQTLSNCERFVTERLKEIEEAILGADEKLVLIEYNEFVRLREHLLKNVGRIQDTANAIAMIDVLTSFALVSEKNNYIMPSVLDDNSKTLNIVLGRHPVVEILTNTPFIPNDITLDEHINRLSIITGPNMSGKSTYMRQTALIVLMAQIGCFVPCDFFEFSIVDRIFTRVGASDDLATGQSTFMIEMSEVSNILRNATGRSLLILDEIGRGTSTFDGLSIAWSVLEYIATTIRARALFATHYHELTSIETKIGGVKNFCVEVKDNDGDIVFLRKIIVGGAKSSYGLHVAKLAGIPNVVIKRANQILELLSDTNIVKRAKGLNGILSDEPLDDDEDFFYNSPPPEKETLFVDEIEKEFSNIDINNLTPMEAFQKLFSIKSKIEKL